MARGWFGVAALAASLAAQTSTGRWEIQYFHDEHDSILAVVDLKFASPLRGVAVGTLQDKRKLRPVAVITSDGGAVWTRQSLEEMPVSLFFLNDSVGWMVTEKGLWQSLEAGRNWRKLSAARGLRRVHFADERRGWAVGAPKLFQETVDGGRTWRKVAVADDPKTDPRHTAYHAIELTLAGFGIVAGSSTPPRRDDGALPPWIDPEAAEFRRQWPTLSLLFQTRDAGKNWTSSASSLFGAISRVRLRPNGDGLLLLQFREAFEWPSEVHRLDIVTGKSSRVFREKDRAVTDVVLLRDGAVLAAVEHPGRLHRSPIPGKVRILHSSDLLKWRDSEIDYRTVATNVILASAGEDLWAATDTGMILRRRAALGGHR